MLPLDIQYFIDISLNSTPNRFGMFFMYRFGKQIRYASRKARADTRKRVKGRFVKAGEEYDYDPPTTSNF